jgi:molybdopterin-guanine dinucleotide biosynthesis protein B
MKLIGLIGWKNSGKTTLIVKLLQELAGRGLKVSTMKHAHHNFDVDTPGKDSYQHRQAGATEVLVSSGNRWVLMHEHRGDPETGVDALLAKLDPVDLVLIEGFKTHDHDKIEVFRSVNDSPPLCHDDPRIVAIASDMAAGSGALADVTLSVFDIDDPATIAEFIIDHCGLAEP